MWQGLYSRACLQEIPPFLEACADPESKVKLFLLFQLASKEGGAQKGPGVFRHSAVFDGFSLGPSGELK